ncbi:MAG: hypothetical protein EOO48_00180 [Flavobacterium sp.]|nr:MAG: hypothetical protein EOO48_00180 [Flavobacterium sp.]
MKNSVATQIQYQAQSGILSTQIAISSFIFGTALLLLNILNPNDENILILGGLFMVCAFLVNAAMFVLLLYCFIREAEHREYFAVKMLIVLANIPVGALYLYILINPIFNH